MRLDVTIQEGEKGADASRNALVTLFQLILEEDPSGPRPRLRQHIVNYTLDQLGSMLDPNHFMRVHRSAIVQFTHIKELIPWFSGRYKLALSGGHEVIASRERSKAVKERLKI